MAGWLDDLLGKNILLNGVDLPDRKRLNFVGGNVTVSDNPALLTTDVLIAAATLIGKDPLVPQSNSGTSSYPVNPTYIISSGVTFARSGAADHDSVRFYGAGGGEPTQVAYTFGQVINLTGFVLDVYPLLTQHTFVDGADLGAGVPVSIAPGASMRWALDVALNVHVPGASGGGQQLVVSKSANYTILTSDNGNLFNDHGSSGLVTFTLPASAPPGFAVEFCDDTGNGLRVQLVGSDVIRYGDEVTAAAGHLQSNYAGNSLRLVKTRSGVYQAMSMLGGWSPS